MQKMIIANVKTAEYQGLNLNQIFDPNGQHEHSFEFQRNFVCSPFTGNGGKLEIFFYTLQPGKANYPYHYHVANEEVYYIVSGQGTLKTPEGEKVVSKGDIIVMPANENGAHMLINTSDEPLTYIEVKTAITPDIGIRPEEGKFSVLGGPGEIFLKTYKMDSDVNYLGGE